MVEVAVRKTRLQERFSPPAQRGDSRKVKSPAAMAIEDNLAGRTKDRKQLGYRTLMFT